MIDGNSERMWGLLESVVIANSSCFILTLSRWDFNLLSQRGNGVIYKVMHARFLLSC